MLAVRQTATSLSSLFSPGTSDNNNNTATINNGESSPSTPHSPHSTALYSGSRHQPRYFSKEAFSKTSFNVDDFISDCRKRVPLENVVSDLKEYSLFLDNELVELINKDYTDFVNLSTKLVGIDQVIENLRTPLEKLRKDVLGVHSSINESVIFLREKLNEKRELAKKKACLQLFLNVNETLQKIENLQLHQSSQSSIEEENEAVGNTHEATSNLIQRAANDFNQLLFYVSKTSEFPFTKLLIPRIEAIKRTMKEVLENLLSNGLNLDSNPFGPKTSTSTESEEERENIIANCLRTYSAMDNTHEAEKFLRMRLIHPYASKVVTLENLEKGKRGSTDGLRDIYQTLLKFIDNDLKLVLNLTQKKVKGYNLIANTVFPEVKDLINTRLSVIFAAGIPDVFHKNYRETLEFVEGLEERCTRLEEVKALREHPSCEDFFRTWNRNLSVYFGIRFGEISKRFESVLSVKLPQPNFSQKQEEGESKEFRVKWSQELWGCLERCWSSQVFVRELIDRFLSLSLQLVSRYRSAVLSAVTPQKSSQSGSAKNDEEEYGLEHCLLFYHDLYKMDQKLKLASSELLMREDSPKISQRMYDIVAACFRESASELGDLKKRVEEQIHQRLTDKCAKDLPTALQLVATQFRLRKTIPTTSSAYVKDILNPPRLFFTSPTASDLLHNLDLAGSDFLKRILENLLSAVTDKYIDAITKQLTKTAEQESGLMRLNNAAKKSGLTNYEAISAQAFLDAQRFGDEVSSLISCFSFPNGSPVPNLELFSPYVKLLQAVAKGNEVLVSRQNSAPLLE
eukprot:TRINITY_DN4313_c0_g1_i1.p1 TRINITY_DN4313_c0_g1~~TRINITY_DN4313_c0_g1_i1.p1  ORF type:complete len:797 (+),score=180.98 TRINITY_DN4313_c0_g1_i1:25-2415(+)